MNIRSAGPVLLLTALSVECQAIRAHLTDLKPRSHPDGTLFEVGRLPGGGDVVIATIGEGNSRAAVLTERAIAMFRPRALIFVGVSGALRDKLSLGDVVVATKVYGYEGGSYEGDTYHARPNAWEAPHELEQLARHIEQTGAWHKHLSGDPAGRPPKVHFEPIASGSLLLNSRQAPAADQLHRFFNDAAAIEMEGVGVSQAGHLNSSYPVLTIRGISDRADGSKESTDRDGWQATAAANAAAFALGLAETLTTGRASHPAGPEQPAADLIQENVAGGGGTIVAAQDGSVHVGDASASAERTADHQGGPRMKQTNTARDLGIVFAAQGGDVYYHPDDCGADQADGT
jgi:adenosylhomocysteine nucleosidase